MHQTSGSPAPTRSADVAKPTGLGHYCSAQPRPVCCHADSPQSSQPFVAVCVGGRPQVFYMLAADSNQAMPVGQKITHFQFRRS